MLAVLGEIMNHNNITAEKTLFDVLRDLWRAKIYLLVFSATLLLFAFVFISFAKDFYRAEMIIAPATHMGQGASPARNNIGEGSISVQSSTFKSNEAFLRFENIYSGVSVATILLQDKEIMTALKHDFNFEFSNPRNNWDASSLSEYLSMRINLEPVSGTPLRKITYLHPNKEFAVYMISRIHGVSDEIIRNNILKEVVGRINYLNSALAKTTNPSHRRSLAALLMEQERLKMLVSIDQPYAASIIEPAHVLSKPRWPDPYVIYPMFLFIGLLMGFIVYGLRNNE